MSDLSNGQPNPNTHAFGHYKLEQEAAQPAIDQPNYGNDLFIQQSNNQNIIQSQWKSRCTLQREQLF